MKQRDAAQVMFSNSEEALATLHVQLTKERSLFQEDIRALREYMSNNGSEMNQKGQLLLGSSPKNNNGFHSKEEDPKSILIRVEQKLIEVKNSVSVALCSWEELRNAELKKLHRLCETFEKLSHKNDNTENLLRLEKKLDALLYEEEYNYNEHNGYTNSYHVKLIDPIISNERDISYSPPASRINCEEPKENVFTSLLLYGDSL